MRNIFTIQGWVFILFIFVAALAICLIGCATLEGLLIDTQEIAATGEANPEITATLTIVDDFFDDPWGGFVAVGMGYGLALLRRWYKKKKGAKST